MKQAAMGSRASSNGGYKNCRYTGWKGSKATGRKGSKHQAERQPAGKATSNKVGKATSNRQARQQATGRQGADGAVSIEEYRARQIKLKTALAETHHLSQQCHNADNLMHNLLDLIWFDPPKLKRLCIRLSVLWHYWLEVVLFSQCSLQLDLQGSVLLSRKQQAGSHREERQAATGRKAGQQQAGKAGSHRQRRQEATGRKADGAVSIEEYRALQIKLKTALA